MKTLLKTVKIFFFKFLFLTYLLFSLLTLSNCKRTENESTKEYLLKKQNETAHLLLQKFDAQLFSCNSKKFLNKTILLDTIATGIIRKNSDYFLKTEVLTNCGQKYFANLKCSDNILEQYKTTKSNHFFLVANIHSLDQSDIYVNADSLDGSKTELCLGNATVLTGECLALAEIGTSIE